MKLALTFLFLSCLITRGQFTEFYCTGTGTNINAGSTTNATPLFEDNNGNWDGTTGVFTCSAAKDLSAISAGMWASIYVDGATDAVFVSRISAVNDGADTITVEIAAARPRTGTAPSTSATGRSIRVGGAWYGPWFSGATVNTKPFNFVSGLMTNTSQYPLRVNFKNDRIYNLTNSTITSNGPVRFEGYTTVPGDTGKAMITGSTVGNGHTPLNASGNQYTFAYLHFATNGASGASVLFLMGGSGGLIFRCTFSDSRSAGLSCSTFSVVIVECEATRCGNGGAATGGINVNSGSYAYLLRCSAYGNTNAAGGNGIRSQGHAFVNSCLAYNNGRNGFSSDGQSVFVLQNCDSYNNASNGVNFAGAFNTFGYVENCNFIDNGLWGINSEVNTLQTGYFINNAFGSGTASNAAGIINSNLIPGIVISNNFQYADNVTPWNNPAAGDFSITLAAAKQVGRGIFPPTATNTIGYPDIGAAQAVESGGGGGTTNIISVPLFRR